MTNAQHINQRKVNIGNLGATLGNISEPFRKLGLSRQHYYYIKQTLVEDGI